MSLLGDTQEAHTVNVDLSCVLESDYTLIRDTCAILSTICKNTSANAFDKIVVCRNSQIYHISAYFNPNHVVEVSKAEFDTVTDVNPLRILNISALYDGEQRMIVKVKACGYDHPIAVTNTDVVRIVKKRKWCNFLG